MINLPTMFGTDFLMMDGKLLGFLQSEWIHRICPRKRRRRRWKGQRDPQRSLCPRMRLWKPHQVQNPSVGRAGCLPQRFMCCQLEFSEFTCILFTIFKLLLQGVLCGHGQQYWQWGEGGESGQEKARRNHHQRGVGYREPGTLSHKLGSTRHEKQLLLL